VQQHRKASVLDDVDVRQVCNDNVPGVDGILEVEHAQEKKSNPLHHIGLRCNLGLRKNARKIRRPLRKKCRLNFGRHLTARGITIRRRLIEWFEVLGQRRKGPVAVRNDRIRVEDEREGVAILLEESVKDERGRFVQPLRVFVPRVCAAEQE
jgi:hypothetical protein